MSDYKEKYEKALSIMEKVKEVFNHKQLSASIDEAFPELADSEGERIRKEILAVAKKAVYGNYESFAGVPCNFEKWVSWLEKQAKKTNLHKFRVGDCIQEINKSSKPVMKVVSMDTDGYYVEKLHEHKYLYVGYNSEDLYEVVELA